jgi:hypothetical protein
LVGGVSKTLKWVFAQIKKTRRNLLT